MFFGSNALSDIKYYNKSTYRYNITENEIVKLKNSKFEGRVYS